jgi:hypothetical protein
MHDDPIAEAIQDGEVPQRTPEELRRALEEVLRTKEASWRPKRVILRTPKAESGSAISKSPVCCSN